MTPRSAADYYRRQQRITIQLLLALRRVWARMDPTGQWDQQYADGIGPQLVMLVTAAQLAAARDADSYIAAVLNELAFGPRVEAGVVAATNLAGVAGDGRSVDGLLGQAVNQARIRYAAADDFDEQLARAEEDAETDRVRAAGDEDQLRAIADRLEAERRRINALMIRTRDERAAAAVTDAGRWLEMVSASLVQDAARAAESVATTARPWVSGYVRMLNPPSCSRCAVLAGKFFRWNDGFERHPLCDCRHIPISEDRADELRTHPDQYFDSLTAEEQDRIFTKAGAQAIRDGADIGQVVNARRGMRQAQVYGHDVLLTTEGTTVRGLAYDALAQRGTIRTREELATRLTRNGPELRRIQRERAKAPRLMPESIYELAKGDRTKAIRLLRANGFIQ